MKVNFVWPIHIERSWAKPLLYKKKTAGVRARTPCTFVPCDFDFLPPPRGAGRPSLDITSLPKMVGTMLRSTAQCLLIHHPFHCNAINTRAHFCTLGAKSLFLGGGRRGKGAIICSYHAMVPDLMGPGLVFSDGLVWLYELLGWMGCIYNVTTGK